MRRFQPYWLFRPDASGVGTCATSKDTLSVKITRACLLHHSSTTTKLQVILNVNKKYCPSFNWHPSFSLSEHYTAFSCWFQFYFLFKKYFKLSAFWRIVISVCIFLNIYHASVFPIIFLCSSLLIIYLFIAPHDIKFSGPKPIIPLVWKTTVM